MQVPGHQVGHPVDPLPAPAHGQQPRLQQGQPPARGQTRPDDHVDHPVLVFQGDENGAIGRGRTLALGDQPGHVHIAAMAALLQFP